MKKRRYIIAALLFCFLFIGCGRKEPEKEPVSNEVEIQEKESETEKEEPAAKKPEEAPKEEPSDKEPAGEDAKEKIEEVLPEEEAFSIDTALGQKINGALESLGVKYSFYENGAEITEIKNEFAVISEEVEFEGVTYPVISLRGVYQGITEFTIPSHIRYIREQAFRDSKIEEIIIPATVEYFSGFKTFMDCKNLKSIVFEGEFETESKWNQTFNGCDSLEEGMIPIGVTETYQTFFSCDNMTSVFLPVGLVLLGEETFAYCSQLETVIIPESVEIISDGVFQSSGIRYIEIPETVKRVDLSSFGYCGQLEELNLVDTAGYSRAYLRKMESLKTVRVASVENLQKIQWLDAPKLELMVLPDDIEEIDADFFSSVEDKGSLTIQVPEKTVQYFQNMFPESNVVAKEN